VRTLLVVGRRSVAQQGQKQRSLRPFCCGLPGAIRSGAIPALITRNGLARLGVQSRNVMVHHRS
jgi:hypothetical protein